MAEPPSFEGAVHDTSADVSLIDVTVNPVGAPGTDAAAVSVMNATSSRSAESTVASRRTTPAVPPAVNVAVPTPPEKVTVPTDPEPEATATLADDGAEVTAFPNASRSVTVIAEVAEPTATTDVVAVDTDHHRATVEEPLGGCGHQLLGGGVET